MAKNQRRVGKATKHGNQNSGPKSAAKNKNELMDVAEIKEEQSIKDEPQPIGNLASVSAQSLDNRGDERSLGDDNQMEEDYEVCSDNDDVKFEVKDEFGEKNEKESESTGGGEGDSMNGDQGEPDHSSDHDAQNQASNGNGNQSCSGKKSTKANAHGKTVKQHRCTHCEYSAKYKYLLDGHLLKHTGEKPFSCKHCSKQFIQRRSLRNHMQVHVDEFLFHCSTCLQGFDRMNGKMAHENGCKKLRYECHLCKKSFGTNKSDLMKHMCVHSGEKLFECKECSKQFTQESNLKTHMKLHAGPRSFKCSKCRQGFSEHDEMAAHEQKCSRRTYECYACGKFIGLDKSNLDQHMRTHTGDRPFKCSQCQKKFTRNSNLKKHMKIHSRSHQ